VGDGDRDEAVVARSQLVGQVADGELGLALEDVKGLLERVAMGRDRRAGWQLAEPDLQVDRALVGADQCGHAQVGQVLVISPPLLVETGYVEGHGSPRSSARAGSDSCAARRDLGGPEIDQGLDRALPARPSGE
jgi:hypothetical protein